MSDKTREALLKYGGIAIFLLVVYLLGFFIPGQTKMPLYINDFAPLFYGLSLILLMVGIYFWASSVYLLRKIGGGTPHPFYNSPRNLVIAGTYKYIRHPIYSGFILLLLAKSLFDNNLVIILELLGIVPILLIIIKIEEIGLLRKFGKDYKSYESKTFKLCPFIY